MTALPTSALRKCSCRYWETRSNVKGLHVPTQNKDKDIYEKNHLLLQHLAVIGRYGPHSHTHMSHRLI